MKKNLLFVLFTFLNLSANAQDKVISFETSEGYSLGNMIGQQDWNFTQRLTNVNIINYDASQGINSVYVSSNDSGYWGNLNLKLPRSKKIMLSVDVKIDPQLQPMTGSEYDLLTVYNNVNNSNLYLSGFFFNSSGKTYIGSNKNYINYTKWEPNVWYNLKAEFDFENQIIDLFFNNKFVITVSIPKDIRWADLVKFEFNNTYTGFKFDNLKITDLKQLELNEYNNTETSIYPNPTTDYININSSEKNNTIKITDLTGKVIFNGINTNKINVTHLTKGVYIIHVKTNKEEFIQKIIKK
ncbi:T9SS type A sorting domain-containing protein [Empedobacter brevis]|uniref:T9SS type A sorting domain-containing protein n=1 Tax=Empedobacter brevis TaxID=247 RepID=UPI00289AC173|nr:T9SS type A sorting domain-containing protein [Empedobacter brevis]